MKIAKNSVAGIYFQVKDLEGNEIMASDADSAMPVLVGMGGLLPGLENALLGRVEGENFSVTLGPAEAWGEYEEGHVERVPLKHIQAENKQRLEPGVIVEVMGAHGPFQATVVKVGKFNADLDMNHPLAGKTVVFDVQVETVRTATEDELSHGHVHGEGCNH